MGLNICGEEVLYIPETECVPPCDCETINAHFTKHDNEIALLQEGVNASFTNAEYDPENDKIILTRAEGTQEEVPIDKATQENDGLMSKEDKEKLDSISEGANAVEVTPTLDEGVKVATITVDGEEKEIFAPESEGVMSVEVTPSVTEGVLNHTITIDGESVDLFQEKILKRVEIEFAEGTSIAVGGDVAVRSSNIAIDGYRAIGLLDPGVYNARTGGQQSSYSNIYQVGIEQDGTVIRFNIRNLSTAAQKIRCFCVVLYIKNEYLI